MTTFTFPTSVTDSYGKAHLLPGHVNYIATPFTFTADVHTRWSFSGGVAVPGTGAEIMTNVSVTPSTSWIGGIVRVADGSGRNVDVWSQAIIIDVNPGANTVTMMSSSFIDATGIQCTWKPEVGDAVQQVLAGLAPCLDASGGPISSGPDKWTSGTPGSPNILMCAANKTYPMNYGVRIGDFGAADSDKHPGTRALFATRTNPTTFLVENWQEIWPGQPRWVIQDAELDLNGSTWKYTDANKWHSFPVFFTGDLTYNSATITNCTGLAAADDPTVPTVSHAWDGLILTSVTKLSAQTGMICDFTAGSAVASNLRTTGGSPITPSTDWLSRYIDPLSGSDAQWGTNYKNMFISAVDVTNRTLTMRMISPGGTLAAAAFSSTGSPIHWGAQSITTGKVAAGGVNPVAGTVTLTQDSGRGGVALQTQAAQRISVPYGNVEIRRFSGAGTRAMSVQSPLRIPQTTGAFGSGLIRRLTIHNGTLGGSKQWMVKSDGTPCSTVGQNYEAGVLENWHALFIGGTTELTLEDLTLSNVYGDGLYLAPITEPTGDPTGLFSNKGFVARDCFVEGTARQSVTPIDGVDVLFDNVRITKCTRHPWDVEPADQFASSYRWTFQNCYWEKGAIDPSMSALSGYWMRARPRTITVGHIDLDYVPTDPIATQSAAGDAYADGRYRIRLNSAPAWTFHQLIPQNLQYANRNLVGFSIYDRGAFIDHPMIPTGSYIVQVLSMTEVIMSQPCVVDATNGDARSANNATLVIRESSPRRDFTVTGSTGGNMSMWFRARAFDEDFKCVPQTGLTITNNVCTTADLWNGGGGTTTLFMIHGTWDNVLIAGNSQRARLASDGVTKVEVGIGYQYYTGIVSNPFPFNNNEPIHYFYVENAPLIDTGVVGGVHTYNGPANWTVSGNHFTNMLDDSNPIIPQDPASADAPKAARRIGLGFHT